MAMTENDELAKQVSQDGPQHDGECADAAKRGTYTGSAAEASRKKMVAGTNRNQTTVQPFSIKGGSEE